MNRIVFPLEPQMQGPKVADLQAALQLLLDGRVTLSDADGARSVLSEALKSERAEQVYGGSTSRMIGTFREESDLEASGNVDERINTPSIAKLDQTRERQWLIDWWGNRECPGERIKP